VTHVVLARYIYAIHCPLSSTNQLINFIRMQRLLHRSADLLLKRNPPLALAPTRFMHTKASQTLTLHNGSTLGYAEFGSPDGFPVFYFHGTPGSRLEAKGWETFANSVNARIIGLDRPGIGFTTLPKRHCTLLDWPDKVLQLADHLKLDSFSVLGASGGGPFSIACAHSLPVDRLRRSGVAAGMGPIECGYGDTSWGRYLAFQTNIHLPASWLRWIVDRAFTRHALNPDPKVFETKVIDKIIKEVLPHKDAAFFDDPVEKQDFADDWRQALAQGAEGYVRDSKIIFSPWPFQLADVGGEVRLWYGTEDTFTPLRMARYMAKRMPNAKLVEMPGRSHMSLGDDGEEILRELIAPQ